MRIGKAIVGFVLVGLSIAYGIQYDEVIKEARAGHYDKALKYLRKYYKDSLNK